MTSLVTLSRLHLFKLKPSTPALKLGLDKSIGLLYLWVNSETESEIGLYDLLCVVIPFLVKN